MFVWATARWPLYSHGSTFHLGNSHHWLGVFKRLPTLTYRRAAALGFVGLVSLAASFEYRLNCEMAALARTCSSVSLAIWRWLFEFDRDGWSGHIAPLSGPLAG